MAGMFPILSNMLGKRRVPMAQQNANPMQYQQMPVPPNPTQPAQVGQIGNEQFNEQQKLMNRGKLRRGMGRMG